MLFIDTHSHIFLPEFDNDRNEVIKRAFENGIKKIILPNVDSSTIDPLLALEKKYPNNCFPLIGLHPTSVKEGFESELKIVKNWVNKKIFYGIGEIGIDLYWDKTYKKQQIIAFENQIELAKKNNLPIIIHSRESFPEIFNIMDNQADNNLKGIFHAFSGNIEQAEKAISYGFKLGIGGIVTFKNSGLDKVIEQINIENLVLETDSPYLAPVPKRGKRNESSYIIYIAQKISEIFKIDIEQVAEITSKNTMEIFKFV
ncbi:MAG: TatD family hydrolase [Bacteroidales bacterium]|nr:TatD family hydrolase [Bacteroidales bacterium]